MPRTAEHQPWMIVRLRGKRAKLAEEADAILEAAAKADRDLTAEEKTAFEAKKAELVKVAAQIEKEWDLHDYAQTCGSVEQPDGPGAGTDGPVGRGNHIQVRPGDMIFRNATTGHLIRALAPTDRFASDPIDDGEPYPVGRRLAAWMSGDMPSLRAGANQGGVDTQGGYLFEPRLSQEFVDLARAQTVCIQAGARTIPMEAAELHIARATSDPIGSWRGEGMAVQAAARTFDRVVMKARTVAAIVPITIELLQDVVNLPAMLEDALAKALGLKLDQAALAGTGAESQPLGVRNYPTANTVTGVGTPTDYSEASTAVKKILQANYVGSVRELAWILNPRDAATYDNLQDTLHQPLRMTPWVSQLSQLFTTSVATTEGVGGNESYSVVGDFSQMVIGMRTNGVTIRRVNSGAVTDIASVQHNAVAELKEFLVAHLRVDVALLRPTWFTVLSGITAAA